MKYTGTIYRPPIERDTLLLQVTVGCAHNACTFCNMYRDVQFSVETIEQIESDLKKAKGWYGSLKRIFLVNGDAFTLSYERLKEIASKIIEYFPEMETISMYSSVQNVMQKTDKELEDLRENYRINDLYFGMETGHEKTLEKINKGHTREDAIEQLARLDRAGIDYIQLFMLGVAGKGNGSINAKDTADLINKTNPKIVWFGTLGIYSGSPLEKERQEGKFIPATELEILEEKREVLQLIEHDNLPFFGVHPTNIVPIQGTLGEDKERMITSIDGIIEKFGKDKLNKTLERHTL